ncbi:hypothetical protein F4678DRAFT_413582 [Xylaria arbuscula]|nr:hypothetical protein F4678DRAFT_413582 [Xylaria arbuscula]
MEPPRTAAATTSIVRVNDYRRTWERISALSPLLHPDWEKEGAAGSPELQARIPQTDLDCINKCTKLVITEFEHQIAFESREEMERSMYWDSGVRYVGLLESAIDDICDDLAMMTRAYMDRQQQKDRIQRKRRPFNLVATWWVTGVYKGRANGRGSPLRNVTGVDDLDPADFINGSGESFGWTEHLKRKRANSDDDDAGW